MTKMDTRGHKAASKWVRVLIPVLIIAVGLGVLLYPVIATQWNNSKQSHLSREYADLNQQIPPETLRHYFEDAQAYNNELSEGKIVDPWINNSAADDENYKKYLSVLSYQDAMARLVVPSAKVDLPVYHGSGEDSLQRGVGHLFGSDLPVGGEGTHSILTAHTGLSKATLFDNLVDVKKGDPFYISVAGENLKYEVDDIRVVLPTETDSLHRVPGKDLVTLITCTPYGINTHRLLVTGHRVPMDPASEDSLRNGPSFAWQWWMYAIAIAALIIVLALMLWIRSIVKNRNKTLETDRQKELL